MSANPEADSASRTQGWQRLESLVTRATNNGVGSLSEQELWELPSLYRRAFADLSLLRNSHGAPYEQQRLSQLCNRAHAIVYAGQVASGPRQSVGHYLLAVLPATLQRRKWYVLAAGALLVFFAAVGWVHAATNPKLAETILPPSMFRGYQARLESATKQADLRLAAQIKKEDRPTAAFEITLNNIRVSANVLVLGVAGGIPSILMLGFNGYLVGVLGYVYFSTPSSLPINLPLYFVAGIAPHGSIELPAICVASAAGMLIGFAWLFPGQRGRGDSLRAAVPDAMRMLLIVALTLLVAGSIEGFITPMNPPASIPLDTWYWGKIALGAVVFSAWLCWLANPKAKKFA